MDTETEARYVVRTQIAFDRLRQMEELGPYTLSAHGTARISDYYLDTRGHALLRQGWACRLRAQNGDWLVTLKGPKQVDGAIVSRSEIEILLPERSEDPTHWPDDTLQATMHALTGGLPLRHLAAIKQRRHRYDVRAGKRLVAELSLDQVRIIADGMRHRSYMLECELRPDGRMEDLVQIDTILQAESDLAPEPRSKLQRALELVEQGGSPDEPLWRDQPPTAVDKLATRFDLDLETAEHAAALAERLYDGLQAIHRLPAEVRPTLRLAAYLHGIGDIAGHSRATAGRDILWRHSLAEVTSDDQAVLAAAAFLHRGPVTPDRLTAAFMTPPSPELERRALAVAALVRMAAALDRADPALSIAAIADAPEPDVVRIELETAAPKAARQARGRSDLWRALTGRPIAWHSPPPPAAEDVAPAPRLTPRAIGITPQDSMAAAGIKVFDYFYHRMLEHEAGTRLGRDPEELHDMRVATRRLRSALRLFGPYLPRNEVEHAGEALRTFGRLLGEVRDMDVALAQARTFLTTRSAEAGPDLSPLFAAWRRRRTHARRRLLRYFHSRAYPRLREACRALIEHPQPEAVDTSDQAHTVRRLMPRLLLIDWQRILAYNAVMDEAPVELLHALRIDGKRLRYALEFFMEALPEEIAATIPLVMALQDHLGEMHDAAVAIEMVDEVLADTPPGEQAGPLAYRQHCTAQVHMRRATLDEVWLPLQHKRWRQQFKALLAE